MSGVISLTILLVIYAASEYVARRTNGIIDTVNQPASVFSNRLFCPVDLANLANWSV